MSSAQLTGLAALGNGRIIEGKALLFDANFYISDGETVVASLRYFNKNDMEFEDKAMYEVRASVARMPDGGVTVGTDETEELLEDIEYDLIGDITWLHKVTVQNPRQRPYLDIISTAKNVLTKDATFDLEPQQFIQLLSKQQIESVLPIRAIIPDSPRYKFIEGKSTKPIPKQNSNIAASGFLTRVLPKENDPNERPSKFIMAVDSVTFLGRTSKNPLPETRTQVRSQKGKRKKLIDFDAPDVSFVEEGPSTKKVKLTVNNDKDKLPLRQGRSKNSTNQ
ncbi:hypothetical protein FB446DRAFT_773405 [Lentinula raphanica]|nr:hypothetical protein FB446DRAFT_773405 [Lentinula raphanica]